MRQHLRIYSNSDIVAKTPPLLKVVELALLLQHLLATMHATPASVNVSALNLSSAPAAAVVLPGSTSVVNVFHRRRRSSPSLFRCRTCEGQKQLIK
ncbi:hypothetical protein QL285_059738 [Trifolium repens]|nr:hypothetical protein QL285_059738 [Trifolium repens]